MTIGKISLHCILRFPLEEVILKMKIKKNTLSFKKSCVAYFLRQSNLCVVKITYRAMAFSLSSPEIWNLLPEALRFSEH